MPRITKYLFTFQLQNNTRAKKYIYILLIHNFPNWTFHLTHIHYTYKHTSLHAYTRMNVCTYIYNLGFLLIHSKYTYTDLCISFPPIAQAKRFPGRRDFAVFKRRCERFENRRETKFKYLKKLKVATMWLQVAITDQTLLSLSFPLLFPLFESHTTYVPHTFHFKGLHTLLEFKCKTVFTLWNLLRNHKVDRVQYELQIVCLYVCVCGVLGFNEECCVALCIDIIFACIVCINYL